MARTGEHAPQSFTGFDRLADRAVAWLAERRREAREAEAARRAENPPPFYPRGRWAAMTPEARAELWAVRDMAMDAALGSPSIMTYGAAAARLGNASRFAAMSRRGAGDAAIRRATRYERGPFGYGVETRGDAALRPAAVFGAVREGSLGELAYIHPEVARAYPTMRDVKVEMVPSAEWADRLAAAKAASAEAGGAGSTGAYAKATDTILVKGPSEAEPINMFADRADRTLVHEMQHAAQARDGLLGKTAGDYRTAAKEVDARNSANRRWLGPAERREMPRANTQDVRPEEVHMDDKGGKSPHENFRNFLATDEVPESIFGIPVVQDEGGYTEKDIEFFKENPKAAGFYEMGDEEVDEDAPQQATGAGVPMLASIFGPVGLDNLRKAEWKNLPELAEYNEHGHKIQIGELKDLRLRKGWEQALLWKNKKLSDILDFSSPQGKRLITAYPGVQDIVVTNEDRGAGEAYGSHGGTAGRDEYIWLNPRRIGVRGGDVAEQYDTILHEGINHAIYAREPSFQGPNIATHDLPSSKLTPLGYAMNLNEVLASLASRRGAERAKTGKGEANSAQLAKEIFPEVVRRVNDLTKAELEESQGKMLAEDVVLPRAAEPEDDTDPPPEEPVPDHLDAKGGNTRSGAGAGETAEDVHGLVQKFKDHVRTYENRRVEPYRDVDGNWAVGYGSHFLADGTKVTPNTAVTDRMIDGAFDADLVRRVDLLAGYDRRQARFAVPNWRYMSPESRLMLLDVSWGRKDTLTEKKSPGLFGELRAAGKDKAALDDAVRRHYLSYRKATDANGAVDESKTAGLQNRRIALLKALTGEDFSYDGKKWSTEKNKFVEE